MYVGACQNYYRRHEEISMEFLNYSRIKSHKYQLKWFKFKREWTLVKFSSIELLKKFKLCTSLDHNRVHRIAQHVSHISKRKRCV